MIHPKLLEILICPKCKSDQLDYQKEKSRLVCKSCKQIYKIEEDIPIMIIEDGQVDA